MKRIIVAALLLMSGASLFGQDFNLEVKSTMSFPGQTLANIAGYVQDGREYALIGASEGMVVVDITDPTDPQQIVQIPGPDNLWKEIKVYQNYAYVTSEGGFGLQIVDLSPLPSADLPYQSYYGDGDIDQELQTIHALHIDTTKGFAYLYGSNIGGRGATVVDLNQDPFNPTYAGEFQQLGYIHDGFADNDTLYGCHIYAGLLSIVDMTDKNNPVLLGSVETPGKFAHNSWPLSDHKTILTTDEKVPSFLTAYDISDPTDIKELDRYSTNDGNGSIGHNTHIHNNWAVTSWYTDGFTIVDAHKPDNLVLTGQYDTYPGTGPGFDGCWGVYPYFPSGTIIASNIEPAELFILTPEYKRAAYLEGTVTDGCTGFPLTEVDVIVNSNYPQVNTKTNNFGVFKTGMAEYGTVSVTVGKTGFISQTFDVDFVAGEVAEFDIVLEPVSAFEISATVMNAETGQPIPFTNFLLGSPTAQFNVSTNMAGEISFDCLPGGDYQLGTWGYLLSDQVNVNADGTYNFDLQPGYYDDFALDLNWTSINNANTGAWELGIPNGTTYQGNPSNPGMDSPLDNNENCYVTGNGGGNGGSDDVDNGEVILSSPPMNLAAYDAAELTFYYWFFNQGGQNTPNDQLTVQVTNGTQTAILMEESGSESFWRYSGEIELSDYIDLNDNVRVEFITSDLQGSGNIVEAGVDVFQVIPKVVSSTNAFGLDVEMQVSPNPSQNDFLFNYTLEADQQTMFRVFNTLGQLSVERSLDNKTGSFRFGAELQPGIYFIQIASDEGNSEIMKIIKK